ncbi:MAG: YfcE family phosphodiesterase [Firmicutes bacterium]|nr:YfcE family phosphodiesterase [Bacillota bacterium]
MKVVIVSDSHGNFGVLKRIAEREMPFDLMFHLGDGIEEAVRVQQLIGFNLDGVEGNNDVKGIFPASLTLGFGKKRCLFTHGHLFEPRRDLSLLAAYAKQSRADLVFFGHTHQYYDGIVKGVRLLNPGSVCSHLTKEAAYLLLKVDEKGLKIEKVLI